jgi:hypothetical protein
MSNGFVRTITITNGAVSLINGNSSPTGSGSLVTGTDFATQSANTFLAGPSSGSVATPTFRVIVPADLPVGTNAALGAIQVDGTTISVSAGIISVIPVVEYPNVLGSANLTGQTGAATILTVTPTASLGTYRISPYLTITAILVDVANIHVTYKDETGTSRTQTFSVMGTTSPALGSVGAFTFPPITIRAASGTNIVVSTVLTTGTGSITYDAGTVIEQLA